MAGENGVTSRGSLGGSFRRAGAPGAGKALARHRGLGAGSLAIHFLVAGEDAPLRAGPGDGEDGGRGERPGRGPDWQTVGGVPPLEAPEEHAPFQHRSEFEPGRRRGRETDRARLKEEKGQ